VKNKKQILIINRNYVPSYKSGGPVRTLENMTKCLKGEYDFFVMCRNRDSGDDIAYPGIHSDSWNVVDGVSVYYCGHSTQSLLSYIREMRRRVKKVDCVYFNSFWDVKYTVLPLVLVKFFFRYKVPVLLAPRGEMYEGALKNKDKKKKWGLRLGGVLRVWKGVKWHFSTKDEYQRALKVLDVWNSQNSYICNNLSIGIQDEGKRGELLKKQGNHLTLCMLARIHPHKNLSYLLNVLSSIDQGSMILNIYGEIYDTSYWSECEALIEALPQSITVNYCGLVNRDEVMDVYAQSHLCVLPTKSENFGHTIRESIMAGCPVLISDQTPWRALKSQGLGHDIALSNEDEFRDTILEYLKMDSSEYAEVRTNVVKGAEKIVLGDEALVKSYIKMFDDLMSVKIEEESLRSNVEF